MSRTTLARLLAQNPVVVTGAGAISAAGESVNALWNAVAAGQVSAVQREFTRRGRLHTFTVCPASTLDPTSPKMHPVRRMDRCAQLAWHAALDAWASAGLEAGPDQRRIGVMLGTSRGPLGKLQDGFSRLEDRRYPPSLSTDCTIASLSGVLAQGLKAQGPTATVAATCASGAFAIALAAEQIVLGNADVMLAGGAEAPLIPAILAQLDAMRVLGSHDDPARTCRPFDVTRNGLCLGEGSGFLVLESAEHARRRNAAVRARLSGWALGVDGSGRAGLDPTGAGLVELLGDALRTAALDADAIHAVNTHGTGTQLNDLVEARALRACLGPRASTVPCSATKPVTGHCLGATPALEAIVCIESLRHQIVPPTANCRQLDPRCPIHIPNSAVQVKDMRHVLSTSLGFWGYQAALIFSSPSP
jgi:3-oxoacyl-[acyl-carrier-protein] synthase II